jgi:putative tryptophan/tyrosine transport system substrate-binding protein
VRINRIIFVLLCMSFVLIFTGPALADKKVLVLLGASPENATLGGYEMIYEGIHSILKPAGIVPQFLWVDLDSLTSAEQKLATSTAAIPKIRAMNPDLIIAVNDDCVVFFGQQIDDIPMVFTYVFAAPASMGLPKVNITGVLRRSYAVDIWAMAKKLLNVNTVEMISKNSSAMEGVKHYITAGADQLAAASGVKFLDMHLVDTFTEWQDRVKNISADFIYLADTSRISQDDKMVTRTEISRWTASNAKVPVIAATEEDVAAGALFSIVTSEEAQGAHAAEIALRILNGAAPSDIPYETSVKGKLVINAATAQKMKVDIPYEILSSAEAIFE